jgi:hypothetical protein
MKQTDSKTKATKSTSDLADQLARVLANPELPIQVYNSIVTGLDEAAGLAAKKGEKPDSAAFIRRQLEHMKKES